MLKFFIFSNYGNIIYFLIVYGTAIAYLAQGIHQTYDLAYCLIMVISISLYIIQITYNIFYPPIPKPTETTTEIEETKKVEVEEKEKEFSGPNQI
jgi:hypothetical protein